MGLHKIIKIVSWIFGIAGIVSLILIIMKGDQAIKDAAELGDTAAINPMYVIAFVILILVLVVVLIFVLKGVFAGNIKKTLLSIGMFLAVVLVSYVLASGEVKGLPLTDGEAITESGSKWVGTGLIAFYLLAITAVGAMVLSGVKKITSK